MKNVPGLENEVSNEEPDPNEKSKNPSTQFPHTFSFSSQKKMSAENYNGKEKLWKNEKLLKYTQIYLQIDALIDLCFFLAQTSSIK